MLSLDVGCGTFNGSTQHGTVNVDVVNRGVKVENFVLADGYALPFRSGVFDRVYFMEVIEHLSDPARLLREIHRVLKAEGLLVLSTPNPLHYRNCLFALRGGVPHDEHPEHRAAYLPSHVEVLFGEAGFVLVGFDFRKLIGVTHHTRLDDVAARVLPHVVGGYNMICWGKKT